MTNVIDLEVNKETKTKYLKINDNVGISKYDLESNEDDKLRLDKLLSSYVNGGFCQDKVSIVKADFFEKSGSVTFEMDSYFMPSDNSFHLSSLMSQICVLHIGVIYSHLDTGSLIKNREVYLISESMEYKKPIRDLIFSINFEITNVVTKKHNKKYTANVDFNNGSFIGTYTWLIPLIKMDKMK